MLSWLSPFLGYSIRWQECPKANLITSPQRNWQRFPFCSTLWHLSRAWLKRWGWPSPRKSLTFWRPRTKLNLQSQSHYYPSSKNRFVSVWLEPKVKNTRRICSLVLCSDPTHPGSWARTGSCCSFLIPYAWMLIRTDHGNSNHIGQPRISLDQCILPRPKSSLTTWVTSMWRLLMWAVATTSWFITSRVSFPDLSWRKPSARTVRSFWSIKRISGACLTRRMMTNLKM